MPFSEEEISVVLGMPLYEVRAILDNALKKLNMLLIKDVVQRVKNYEKRS